MPVLHFHTAVTGGCSHPLLITHRSSCLPPREGKRHLGSLPIKGQTPGGRLTLPAEEFRVQGDSMGVGGSLCSQLCCASWRVEDGIQGNTSTTRQACLMSFPLTWATPLLDSRQPAKVLGQLFWNASGYRAGAKEAPPCFIPEAPPLGPASPHPNSGAAVPPPFISIPLFLSKP